MPQDRRKNDEEFAVIKKEHNKMMKTLYGNGRKGIAYTMEVLVWQVRLNYLLEAAIIGLAVKIIFFGGKH